MAYLLIIGRQLQRLSTLEALSTTIPDFNFFISRYKALFLGMKCTFQHQNVQIFCLKTVKITDIC